MTDSHRLIPVGEIFAPERSPALGPRGDLLKNARTQRSQTEDDQLALDIFNRGLEQPIVVTTPPANITVPAGKKWLLVMGYRRFSAFAGGMMRVLRARNQKDVDEMRQGGVVVPDDTQRFTLARDMDRIPDKVPAIVRAYASEVDIAVANLCENVQRHQLHWTDAALRIALIARAGKLTDEEISTKTSLSLSYVRNLARVGRQLAPELLEKGRQSGGGLTSAVAIALAAYDSPEKQRAAWEQMNSGATAKPGKRAPGDRKTRLGKLETLMADIEAGNVRPRTPRAPPDAQHSAPPEAFAVGYDNGWKDGARTVTAWLLGRGHLPKRNGD